MTEDRHPHAIGGLAMGAGAILLWSLSSASIVLGGKQLGAWQFLAVTSSLSGLLQLAGYLASGRRLCSLLRPPPKLWLAVTLGFILYLLLYTAGLVTAQTETQAVGVSLMNYLWPSLAVLFTTWLVPGEQMHRRLALALILSLAGVLLANGPDVMASGVAKVRIWPYVLGGAAAVSWAAYCALISRWRHWARDYAAAPLGFLCVGTIALLVCLGRGTWQPMTGRIWGTVLLTALGPWAGGYMLWEMALHRASGITLGLMAASTPILSTLSLIGLFTLTAAGSLSGSRVAILLIASAMIGISVALGTRPAKPRSRAETP